MYHRTSSFHMQLHMTSCDSCPVPSETLSEAGGQSWSQHVRQGRERFRFQPGPAPCSIQLLQPLQYPARPQSASSMLHQSLRGLPSDRPDRHQLQRSMMFLPSQLFRLFSHSLAYLQDKHPASYESITPFSLEDPLDTPTGKATLIQCFLAVLSAVFRSYLCKIARSAFVN